MKYLQKCSRWQKAGQGCLGQRHLRARPAGEADAAIAAGMPRMHERLQRCVGSSAQRTSTDARMRQAAGGARDTIAEAAPCAHEGIHLRLRRQPIGASAVVFYMAIGQ